MRILIGLAAMVVMMSSTMAQTKFTPREIDDLLPNPDIGWETFHHTAANDRNLPKWLPSTVYYFRWGWKDFEPTHGDYSFAKLEKELNAATESGQTSAFRIMCCSSSPRDPYIPAWLKEIGGRIVTTQYEGATLEVPDLDDPKILDAHLELIRQLGKKYDGDPRISHVDMGSVGWWGEWHMSGPGPAKMPSDQTCRKIVDAYLSAFKKTPLVMLIGDGKQTGYACTQGAGWRADCLGDLGGFSKSWCHMRKLYPEAFREAKLDDAWKRGLVAYESCWDMRRWTKENWSLRYIFNYALATHASVLNNKSAPLPIGDDVRAEVERFVRRLGYRIVLRDVTVNVTGRSVSLTSTWQNVGSAPIYRPYRIAWRATTPDGEVLRTTITDELASQFMPGEVDVFTKEFIKDPPELPNGKPVKLDQTYQFNEDIAAGNYVLSVAIVDAQTGKPVIRLANEGRGDDGWYTLGSITVPPR